MTHVPGSGVAIKANDPTVLYAYPPFDVYDIPTPDVRNDSTTLLTNNDPPSPYDPIKLDDDTANSVNVNGVP